MYYIFSQIWVDCGPAAWRQFVNLAQLIVPGKAIVPSPHYGTGDDIQTSEMHWAEDVICGSGNGIIMEWAGLGNNLEGPQPQCGPPPPQFGMPCRGLNLNCWRMNGERERLISK
jgi:hypothetical protein